MGNITTTHVASWGIRDSHTGATILEASEGTAVITSLVPSTEPVMAPEHNEVGSVIGQAIYDVHTAIRCSMNIKASVAEAFEEYRKDPTKFETVVTIDDAIYYCTSLEIVESNQDYMKFNCSLERYKHDITPWDASAGGST